ncbi:hypothetical protein HY411_02880, partial [Candidatus Gottesmanbacteria bacterium]|nr:hypothetical protein [Candidatus Gottesmanbacteria bacterium]
FVKGVIAGVAVLGVALLWSAARTEAATCGNAAVEVLEQCDDGNGADFDGCSSACLKEYGLDSETTVAIADGIDCQRACEQAGYTYGDCTTVGSCSLAACVCTKD